jgi:hypothetical protein
MQSLSHRIEPASLFFHNPAMVDKFINNFPGAAFMGAVGKNRVFLLAPKSLQLKKPTDLSGITMVLYSEPQANGNWRSALGAATNQIQ